MAGQIDYFSWRKSESVTVQGPKYNISPVQRAARL